jgi:phosphoribosylamine--glycine ligase
MGAYSPLDWAPDGLADDIVRRVAQPTIDEMRRRGTPFVGVLYVGLALTSRGPRVIEFNARFGDPDGQASLARLDTPFAQLLLAAATGGLGQFGRLRWSSDHAVVVVIAASDYPASPRTGDLITGLDAAAEVPGAVVLHAGTALDGSGALVSAGGRVLDVVAVAPSLAKARQAAYDAVAVIELEGSHHRSDIALRAERGEITVG